MARTPTSKLIETIEEVARLQGQMEELRIAVERLTARIDAVERPATRTLQPGSAA